jgi:lipoprotein NlpI/transglutaminase-like putative cysteine protease
MLGHHRPLGTEQDREKTTMRDTNTMPGRRLARALSATGICLLLAASPATVLAATPKAKPAGTTAEGFGIEAAPSWVQPIAPDPALNAAVSKAPLQFLLIDVQSRASVGDEAHFRHVVRQVNDAAGLQAGAQIQVEFDPSYQTLLLHRIELWRGNARIDKLDRRKVQVLQRESQLERQMVDGRRTASIVLDDVRVGDRIEYAYSLRGANPVFDGRFVDSDWSVDPKGPTALFRYRLISPESRNIRLRADPARHEVASQVSAGWRETIVRRTGSPQFQYDGYAPVSVYQPDTVQASEFADWNDVARWAARVFANAGAAPTPAVQAQAAALRQAAGDDPAERLRRTLDFVQAEVRYFGTEIGANTHRPAEPDKVLKQRFGDCKDKATLLAALLKAQGLSATPVLVSTGYRADVAGMLPSPLAFNHVIARVQLGDQTWWLDGTRAQQTGPLPERQSTGLGRGLLADAATSELSVLPDGRQMVRVSGADRIVFRSLAEDPVLDAELTYHGDHAEGMRAALAAQPASEVEKQFAAEYGRHYTGAELDGPMQVDEIEGHNALRLRLHFKLPGYLRLPDGKTLAGDYGLVSIVQLLRLPDQVPRKLPMMLGSPGIYRHAVEFSFPEELFSRESRQPFDLVDRHFELHMISEARRDGARISGELRLLDDRLEAAEWPAHREQLVKLWPKVEATVNIPSVNARQAAALGDRATSSDQQARASGRVRSKAQLTAQVQMWLAQARLDSNRLPPKLRAQVLVDLGVQQDHLGLLNEAARNFEEALKLDPRNSDGHAGMSVNALLRREDALAIDHASRALQLSPNDTGPRYTRAYARYYAGEAGQARDELLEILRNRTDAEKGYATLWLHLATRRLGGDGAAAIKPYQSTDTRPAWPQPVVQLLSGTGTLDQALAAARADKEEAEGRLCELYFFLGQQQLLEGRAEAARDSFQKAVNTGVVEFTEYALAQRELQKLAVR